MLESLHLDSFQKPIRSQVQFQYSICFSRQVVNMNNDVNSL